MYKCRKLNMNGLRKLLPHWIQYNIRVSVLSMSRNKISHLNLSSLKNKLGLSCAKPYTD